MNKKRIKILTAVISLIVILTGSIIFAQAGTNASTKEGNSTTQSVSSGVFAGDVDGNLFMSDSSQEEQTEVPTETVTEAPVVNISDVSETLYVKSALNVRSGFGTEYPVIGGLSYADTVTRTGICDNGWSRIEYRGNTAYVSSKYLQAEKIEKPVVTAAPVQQKSYNPMLQAEGNISTKLLDTAQSEISKVPANVLNYLYNNGWTITITTKDIASEYYHDTSLGKLAGLTMSGPPKKIYIEDSSYDIKHAMVHEIGHAVDFTLGVQSCQNEFYAIYNEEKNTFNDVDGIGDGHAISSSQEFFAECFHQYFKFNENLRNTAPKAYDFIGRLLGTIN